MTTAQKINEETRNLTELAYRELDNLVSRYTTWGGDEGYTIKVCYGNIEEIFRDETELGALRKAILVARHLLEEQEEYEIVDHPQHYGGASAKHEAISVIEEWNLGFHLGNVVKYISRAGKKPDQNTIDDLKKAKWYLERYIQNLEDK